MKKIAFIVHLPLLIYGALAHSFELSGNISVQDRYFFDEALSPSQHDNYVSASIEPEFYHNWDDGNQSFTFTPFYRHDQYDDERTHADIREMSWQRVFDDWELTVGISKVFWGVTETQHLVDIINQTDQVENIDGEDKLGQPMVRFSTEQEWGILDFFILPGFRERTFPGIEGRPRQEFAAGTLFDADAALYESSDGDDHIDYAVRWLAILDEWELGLSHFYGTGREPDAFVFNSAGVLVPYYALINQTGLDMQALVGDWTWKLEMISRENSVERFLALTGGFEYTLVGINDTNTDLGIVIEYLYDDRDQAASTPFQNDITTAFRITLNDVQSSELLIGITTDIDEQTVASFVEASRRISDSFKAAIEIRTFSNTTAARPLHSFRQDDFMQAELSWYF